MAELVYETPNGIYKVFKNTDAKWQEVFGHDAAWFSVLKKWDSPTEDQVPVRQEEKLKDVFAWFWRNQIISRDEFLYQVKELCPEA